MNDHPANALFAFFTLKTTLKLFRVVQLVMLWLSTKKNERNISRTAMFSPAAPLKVIRGGLGGTPATLYLNSPEQTFNLFFILKHFKKYKM